MAQFVLNDETKKNSHGFYLLNSGGRFERFTENPVMLNNHDLAQLIGKWLNLKIEGNLLVADPEFDEGDEDAMKIKGKVDRKYLRGASPGIIILSAEWRGNPVTDDGDLYVTEWELFEASTVSVPSNAGALTLQVYDQNQCLVNDVKLHVEEIVKLSLSKKEPKIENCMNIEIKLSAEALVALGVKESSDASAISAAIVGLKANLETSIKELKTLREGIETGRNEAAVAMVDLAVKEGRITADKKESFVKLALTDLALAKSTLAAIPVKESLGDKITSLAGGSDISAERKDWTLLNWMQNDMAGLKKLQIENPAVYDRLKRSN